MPVFVDEVIISVEVSNHAGGGAASPPSAQDSKQQVVAECVERVLEILEQRQER